MCKSLLALSASAVLLAFSATGSSAMPLGNAGTSASPMIVRVANGCGPGWYRGPMGACHRYGNGPFPGGYFGPYGHSFAMDHGCGAGRYRGPWGACHKFGTGPYPGGYFGPYYYNNN